MLIYDRINLATTHDGACIYFYVLFQRGRLNPFMSAARKLNWIIWSWQKRAQFSVDQHSNVGPPPFWFSHFARILCRGRDARKIYTYKSMPLLFDGFGSLFANNDAAAILMNEWRRQTINQLAQVCCAACRINAIWTRSVTEKEKKMRINKIHI